MPGCPLLSPPPQSLAANPAHPTDGLKESYQTLYCTRTKPNVHSTTRQQILSDVHGALIYKTAKFLCTIPVI